MGSCPTRHRNPRRRGFGLTASRQREIIMSAVSKWPRSWYFVLATQANGDWNYKEAAVNLQANLGKTHASISLE